MPTSSEVLVALPAGVDLHARPAAVLVRAAMAYAADVTIGAGEREANAKSVLGLLALGARGGTALRLTASGDDAAAALDDLAALIPTLD